MGEPMSIAKLNELLVKMYERRIIRELYNDPTKPWLPESYWREMMEAAHEAQRAAQQEQVNTALNLYDAWCVSQLQKQARQAEDDRLARMSVEELLEDDIPTLWQNPGPGSWGMLKAKYSGGISRPPTQGDQQPAFNWQCYQCGRPITDERKDHAGRTKCDAALMPADYEPWAFHTPKPWDGEEDDEDEE